MIIPETQTQQEFPNDAVKVFSKTGELIRVQDPEGRNLWERPVLPEAADRHCRDCGKAIDKGERCASCWGRIGQKTMRHKAMPQANSDFPVAKKLEDGMTQDKLLAPATVLALRTLLANAGFQFMRTDDKHMVEYHQGICFGLIAATALICGSLGYDTTFLQEEEKEEKNDSSGT